MAGIGGIGMSALAQLLKHAGNTVSGSDRAKSPVTELLTKQGISVLFEQKAENVSEDTDLLVYSAALPETHPERMRARELGIREHSYFQMLGEVLKGKRAVAIAGTHGQTTTTGMLAKILIDAEISPTVVVGSLLQDFGSNYVSGNSDIVVVEACEYQRHFLNVAPEILVITNLEFDHTDYFKDLADVQDAFRSLIHKVPSHGCIVTDTKHPNIAPLLEGISARIVDYTTEPDYELSFPGVFNILNAKAASAGAKVVAPEIDAACIASSLKSFKGTWRRFEYKGKTATGAEVYDDYAHHPTAIIETLRALKEKRMKEGEKGKVLIAFHPHLYSRTRDLLDGFATAFADADEVFIAPIFAAREVDDGTVSSEMLAARIRDTGVHARSVSSLDEIEALLSKAHAGDVIMTMGAGDIYKVAEQLVV